MQRSRVRLSARRQSAVSPLPSSLCCCFLLLDQKINAEPPQTLLINCKIFCFGNTSMNKTVHENSRSCSYNFITVLPPPRLHPIWSLLNTLRVSHPLVLHFHQKQRQTKLNPFDPRLLLTRESGDQLWEKICWSCWGSCCCMEKLQEMLKLYKSSTQKSQMAKYCKDWFWPHK